MTHCSRIIRLTVIPNAMRDLLNVALCLHLEILHCVQDDALFSDYPLNRHPDCNEGSPERGIVPASGDPSLRSG
ncbi:hypothetical protein [Legionella quateirensis]|uniref:hypothetical protein n=1 Tax=Legionella quateirensis TaxID=45072 RepID=UPI0011C04E9A|nr:hypothetical protein [Legionella quateirensis]